MSIPSYQTPAPLKYANLKQAIATKQSTQEKLTYILQTINKHPNIQFINLSNLNLNTIFRFDKIYAPTYLTIKKITLRYNRLTHMPNTSTLTNLEYLDLSHNQIYEFTGQLAPKLKHLNLKSNYINQFIKHLENPVKPHLNLTYLNINKNGFIGIPLGICQKFPNLKQFEYSNNKLDCPLNIQHFVNLIDVSYDLYHSVRTTRQDMTYPLPDFSNMTKLHTLTINIGFYKVDPVYQPLQVLLNSCPDLHRIIIMGLEKNIIDIKDGYISTLIINDAVALVDFGIFNFDLSKLTKIYFKKIQHRQTAFVNRVFETCGYTVDSVEKFEYTIYSLKPFDNMIDYMHI